MTKKAGRPKAGPHVFERRGRFYADVRDFAAVLDSHERSGRIALIPEGSKRATNDRQVADVLYAGLLKELRERSRTHVATGRWKSIGLEAFAAEHLLKKASAGRTVPKWLRTVEHHLSEAVLFFGKDTDVAAIGPADVANWAEHLSQKGSGRRGPDGRERKLGASAQRKYLNSLSNLYRRAISDRYIKAGANPVAALMEKPIPEIHEARFLEVPDASLLLEACRTYQPKEGSPGESIPGEMLHAIVATFLLTGGRASEVLGLTVGDVSFERARVTFRPNAHRRLKTRTSARSVPLWPQLRAILVPWVDDLEDQGATSLLFPSVRGTGMVTDFRKSLDAAAARVGWQAGEIRSRMFRHTYCVARLQTYNRVLRRAADGSDQELQVPVSRDEVARELGHGGTSLVERIYGHVSEAKHRCEQPEYLVENHRTELAPRLPLIVAAA